MAYRYEAGSRRDEPFQFREYQVTILVGGDGSQCGSPLLADALPRHDVGMVVEFGNDDLVARRQVLSPVSLRHEVDALRGAAHEDDFFARAGIDESLYFLSRLLVCVGRTCCQGVGTTVNVRIVMFVIIRNLVDDLQGLLCGGTIVKPYEVVAVHLLVEHGKVLFYFLSVQGVQLLVVEVVQLLCLGDSDAEAVLLRNRPCLCVRVSYVRQRAVSAASSQQLFESRLKFLEIQGLVGQDALTNLPNLFRTIFLSKFLQKSKRTVV